MGFHGDGITAAEAEGEINRVIAVNSAAYTAASAMHYNFRRIHLLPSGQQTSFAMDRARTEQAD